MDRLLEYATRHPLLAGATVVALIAVVAGGWVWERALGGG